MFRRLMAYIPFAYLALPIVLFTARQSTSAVDTTCFPVNSITRLSNISSLLSRGGFTMNPRTGVLLSREPFFVVATKPERTILISGRSIRPEELHTFINSNWDLFRTGKYYIGGWYDSSQNCILLDVVELVPLLDGKKKALELGRHYGQKAIFDMNSEKTIPVPARLELQKPEKGKTNRNSIAD